MTDRAFEIINGSGILTEQKGAALQQLAAELRQTCNTAQIFRTRTEMIVSVLNDIKHPTPDSKYWQAVREQNVMFHELTMLSYEYRKNALEIRKLQRDQLAEEDELEKELINVEIEKKTFIGHNMECTAQDRIREIIEWSNIKAELRPKMAFGDQDVNEHQLTAMKKRFEFEASLVGQSTSPADARNILGLAISADRTAQEDVKNDRLFSVRPELIW